MFKEEMGSIKTPKGMPKWVKKKIPRPQSYTKNYRQLRNAESKRNCLPREDNIHWLFNIKYLKTYDTDEKDIFRNLYVYTYTYKHETIINEKRCLEFERSKEETMGGFGGGNGRDECCNYIIISKIIKTKKEKKRKRKNTWHQLFIVWSRKEEQRKYLVIH